MNARDIANNAMKSAINANAAAQRAAAEAAASAQVAAAAVDEAVANANVVNASAEEASDFTYAEPVPAVQISNAPNADVPMNADDLAPANTAPQASVPNANAPVNADQNTNAGNAANAPVNASAGNAFASANTNADNAANAPVNADAVNAANALQSGNVMNANAPSIDAVDAGDDGYADSQESDDEAAPPQTGGAETDLGDEVAMSSDDEADEGDLLAQIRTALGRICDAIDDAKAARA